ncbi:MAG: hypothetical protein QM749_14725 [Aquabacterium sp.]
MSQSLDQAEQLVSAADKNHPGGAIPCVWMVIGGPAAVVVASIYTAGLAIKYVDPVLDTSAEHLTSPGHAPAMKARNSAAQTALQPADR